MLNPFLLKFINDNKLEPGKALDFGSGEGNDVQGLEKLGWSVVGLNLPEHNLDGEIFKNKQKVDLIYSNYVLPFIKDKQTFVLSIYKNLKNGARVFLITFSKNDQGFKEYGTTEEELANLFIKFKNIKIVNNRVWDDEPGHNHWHELLILTAQK